jgi:tetratricopeptide (TPR) repeat protein
MQKLDHAEDLLRRRCYKEAHRLCLEVLRADPRAGRAWFLLGMLSADHGVIEKAAELFGRAAESEPDVARHHAHLARCLLALNRQGEAGDSARAAAALASVDPLTLDTIGVVLSRLEAHAEAAPLFERAVEGAPDNASFHYNLAASRQFIGDFDGAEAAYRRTLEIDPDHPRAWSGLIALRRQTPEDNAAATLEALFERRAGDADDALNLGHALAKTYDDLGEPEAALHWLSEAKAGKRGLATLASEQDEAVFAAAAETFAGARRGEGLTGASPIFIVGLPRTGTTLVDRILSSHPLVASAGELTAFSLAVKRAAGTTGQRVLDAETLTAASALDLTAIGRTYMEAARPAGADRFTDKMPLNVLYAGLIGRALPDARIVCLRRHPMDSALANYRQLFSTRYPYYDYAYGQEETARYWLAFDRLVRHWRKVLPGDRFTEIAYEGIVADQEGETRRLLAFCGLPWDPACLNFQDNAAPVSTASSVQVRSPLYATSVGRWRRYGEGLAPMRAVFEAAGVALD